MPHAEPQIRNRPVSEGHVKDRNALAGMALMAMVAVAGACDSAIVRLLAGEVHPFVIAFTRVSFGLVALAPVLLRHPAYLKTANRGGHVWRAALKLGALVATFAALQAAPMATVTAIGFAAPLFVTLGAWLMLSERPGPLRLAGMAVGFAGVVVILAPAMGLGEGQALLLALLGAVLTASIQLMLKVMGKSDRAETLVAWNLIVSIPLAAVPAALFWTWPTVEQWALLAVQGVIGTYSQLGVTRAFQLADASLVAPVDFLRLPFAAVVGWFAFAQVPGLATWVGAMLVFVAIVLMAASSSAAARQRGV